MKGSQKELQMELLRLVSSHQGRLKQLQQTSKNQLQQRSHAKAWSALECIDHLNRYGDFYIPEVRNRIAQAQKSKTISFKSSWLGEYFAQSMFPDETQKGMKTFKKMNPSGSLTELIQIEKFGEQLNQWKDLLIELDDYNWMTIKTSISISNIVKLRLGDTLRVVIYHNERHIQQAFRAAGLAL
jgi:hypothetical protein